MDIIISQLLLKMIKIIITNKFTILFVIYLLEKCAKLTKTTIDDKIITFLKHSVMRLSGKGNIVDAKYEYFKQKGLINNFIRPDIIKHIEKEFIKDFNNKENQILPDVKNIVPIPSAKFKKLKSEEINLNEFLK